MNIKNQPKIYRLRKKIIALSELSIMYAQDGALSSSKRCIDEALELQKELRGLESD